PPSPHRLYRLYFPPRRSSDLFLRPPSLAPSTAPSGKLFESSAPNKLAGSSPTPTPPQPLRRKRKRESAYDHRHPWRWAAWLHVGDRKSTRLNSSHVANSYAVF